MLSLTSCFVIKAKVLVVPANEVGDLSILPPALGGDACVADDGLGHLFVTGGRTSTQGAYVLDDRFSVLGLQGGFPTGVGGVGCAANAGVLAVTGGCIGNAEATVVLIEVDGGRRTVDVDAAVRCGSAAAPRSDGQLWFVDGDNSVDLVSSSGVVTAIVGPRTGVRRGLEVTARDAVVFILDGALEYADTDLVTLGPATALGRRGTDVLVLDADGVVSSVENATTRPLADVATIGVTNVAHFVVTDDGTFVGLSVNGTTLHVVDSVDVGGGARTVSTTVNGATRLAVLPGGAIVIGGADVAGLQAAALPR
jgi:hypothetical protein